MNNKFKFKLNERERLLFVMLFFFYFMAISFWAENSKLELILELEQKKDEVAKSLLDNLDVKAKAVSIYNVTKNKKIYQKNDDVKMPIASIAKIMTIIISQGEKSVDTITMSKNAIKQNGNSKLVLKEKWNKEELSKLTLIASLNDGAYALSEIDKDFVNKMNNKAKRLGMTQTFFLNPTGLDIGGKIGASASAEDINIMASFALRSHPDIFKATTLPEMSANSESGGSHLVKNTNTIIEKIPNLLLSKTGFTDNAGGSLVIIFKNTDDEEIAITILGSTFEGRFSDMEKILNMIS